MANEGKQLPVCWNFLKENDSTLSKGRFVIYFGLIWLSACQPSLPERQEKQVEEIPFSGNFYTLELIRNPGSPNNRLSSGQAAEITFRDTLYAFGQVLEGEVIEYAFVFKNTGNEPLLISRARSTCGCTVPEWPENPIPPGGTGKITARFDTKGKTGQQLKPITISANTVRGNTKVYLSGEVLPRKAQ